MSKRKRSENHDDENEGRSPTVRKTNGAGGPAIVTVQIVAGSYDRVLHGITASFASTVLDGDDEVGKRAEFADSFLFNAHDSSIRCLALSPPSAAASGRTQKVFLATGSTDERINVYSLSLHAPTARSRERQETISSLAPRPILESTGNREVGTLMHHSAPVTRLVFPTRSKLLSASEDSSIAVTRTRDWSLLSTVKCPVPKIAGRPSGDTASYGAAPSGVNDFAIHPSLKLMITVSKRERCMRLWNLVTGKKAGVLNFRKDMLKEVGEGQHSTGEGRRVVWGNVDGADEFAVAFEKGALVFGMDSVPKCKVVSESGPTLKLHDLQYVTVDGALKASLLAASTEDGRVLFFSTQQDQLQIPDREGAHQGLPRARLVSQVGGGKAAAGPGRIKSFRLLQSKNSDAELLYLIAGSSDGKVRIWEIQSRALRPEEDRTAAKQAGRLLGSYETHNRITCIEAFVMIPRPADTEESDWEDGAASAEDSDQD
jgi:protein MAK11